MHATYAQKKKACEPQPCDCPLCRGLECFERPRYFAGQLLTEAELNTEQGYVRAKNRLHNRYLHGWGVVCGLEVVCHDCPGWVTVKPGYAIDPCGEDIVLCAEHPFNLIEAINRCRNARRRQRRGDCDPFVPGVEPHCREVEETWCVTIAYDEIETRAMATLRTTSAQPCGCAPDPCGCNNADRTGARGNPAQGHNAGATTPSASRGSLSLGACEPTRTRESFRIGVIEEPPECHPVPLKRPRGDDNVTTNNQPSFVEAAMAGTLLERILRCLTDPLEQLRKRLTSVDLQVITALLDPTTPPAASVPQMHDAVCRLRQAVIELHQAACHAVRCQLLHTLDKILCPEPGPNETPTSYATVARPVVIHLLTLVLQHMLDCVCAAFLPRCSPDPCDERVILACVTVRGDQIIRICNFGCRRYAGAFPSLYSWLSLVPVVPFVRQLLTLFCCSEDMVRTNSPVINDALNFLERFDPAGKLRHSLFTGELALPRAILSDLQDALPKLAAPHLARVLSAETVSLPSLVGQTPAEVRRKLQGVELTEREVASAKEVPALWTLRMNPFVGPGDQVVMYRTGDRVVGFARPQAAKATRPPSPELDELRNEVAALREQVKALQRRRGGR